MDQVQIAEKLQVIQDGINTEGNLINQIAAALEDKSSNNNVSSSLSSSTLTITIDNNIFELIISYIDNKLEKQTLYFTDLERGDTFEIQNILTNSLFWLQGSCIDLVDNKNIDIIQAAMYYDLSWENSYFAFQMHDNALLCLRNPEMPGEDDII